MSYTDPEYNEIIINNNETSNNNDIIKDEHNDEVNNYHNIINNIDMDQTVQMLQNPNLSSLGQRNNLPIIDSNNYHKPQQHPVHHQLQHQMQQSHDQQHYHHEQQVQQPEFANEMDPNDMANNAMLNMANILPNINQSGYSQSLPLLPNGFMPDSIDFMKQSSHHVNGPMRNLGVATLGSQLSSHQIGSMNVNHLLNEASQPYNADLLRRSAEDFHKHNIGDGPNRRKKNMNVSATVDEHGQKVYQCPFDGCSHTTRFKSNLNTHMLTHQEYCPHKCPDCDYETKYKSNLKKHMLSHSDDTPHNCPNCAYKCKFSSNLKTHMLTHKDSRPFACDYPNCNYKSKYKSNLKMHMLTHSAEKRYQCGECEYATKYKSNLSSHMMTHSKETPFACTVCDYMTRYKSNLKNHLKSHAKKNEIPHESDLDGLDGMRKQRKFKLEMKREMGLEEMVAMGNELSQQENVLQNNIPNLQNITNDSSLSAVDAVVAAVKQASEQAIK